MPETTIILDTTAIQRALTRIAHEIAERNEISEEVVLVGIPTGGDHLAARLCKILAWHLESCRAGGHSRREHAP